MGELAGWQEITILFLVASATGVLVSGAVNKYIKGYPVLTVQISMLGTLFLYPFINAYLFVLISPDYDAILSGKMEYLSYGSVMFFAPLPACILTVVIFSLLGKKERTADSPEPLPQSNEQVNNKAGKLKQTAWVLSVFMGGLWFIMIAAKISCSSGKERLIALSAFTIYGVIASFVAWTAFWIEKWFS